MDNKQAIIVTGPESSGTKLVTEILVKAGCSGSYEHHQLFDDDFPKFDSPLVWRRSIPHGNQIPPLVDIVCKLKEGNYDIQFIVTTREFHAILSSQTKHSDVKFKSGPNSRDAMSLELIQLAYKHIFNCISIHNLRYTMVSLESLILQPRQTIYYLLDFLNIKVKEQVKIEIYNPNQKWYTVDEAYRKEIEVIGY